MQTKSRSPHLGGEYEVDEVVHRPLDGAELRGRSAGVHHDLRLSASEDDQPKRPASISQTAASKQKVGGVHRYFARRVMQRAEKVMNRRVGEFASQYKFHRTTYKPMKQ